MVSHGAEHCLSQAALLVVILHDKDPSPAHFSVFYDQPDIEWLHREGIQHPGGDALLLQLLGSLQALIQRDPCPNEEQLVGGLLSDYLGQAHGELFVVVVDHSGTRISGAYKTDTLGVGRQLHSPFRAHSIRGIKNCTAGNATEHGYVLQAHLRGSILSDAATAMGADKIHIRMGNGAHTDLVEGTGEERGMGGNKSHRASPAGGAQCHAHQVLLGYEALYEPLWKGIPKLIRICGVLGVSVEGNYPIIVGSNLGKSGAIGLASGD